MKKEKKRLFKSTSLPTVHRLQYDPDSYSHNFDDGYSYNDPEIFSRSFSARFAVPSKISEDDDTVMGS